MGKFLITVHQVEPNHDILVGVIQIKWITPPQPSSPKGTKSVIWFDIAAHIDVTQTMSEIIALAAA